MNLCRLRSLCADRRSVAAVALIAIAAAQDVPTLRSTDIVLTEGTSISAAMSPDRRWIAFDLLGRLWVMPARGGEAKALTPTLLEARQPTWSPDSQSIAFQAYDAGGWHIYVIPRDGGEARALTSGEFDDREPAWSHHGSAIAFSSDRFGGIVTCWQVDAASGEVRQLSKRDGSMPSWAPNDQEVTIVSHDRVNRDGDPVSPPLRHPGLWGIGAERDRLLVDVPRLGSHTPFPSGAAWNPDGTEVAFTAGTTLYVNGAAASAGEDVFPFRPQWISETELLYTADGHIKRRSLNGRTAVVPFSATVTLQRAALPVSRRVLEPRGAQALKGIVTPVVSPDGRAAAFVALGDLWIQPIGGDAFQVTDDEAVELDPAWSPDGTRLAFASDRDGHMNLWIHDLAARSDTQLTRGTTPTRAPVWSADGSQIVYVAERSLAVAQVAPARGCRLSVPDAPIGHEIGKPAVEPACQTIAVGALVPYSDRYREGLNQLLAWSTDFHSWSTSIVFPQHNAGNRDNNGPVWSPDGLQMAFVTEGKLWTVPVDSRGAAAAPPLAIADDAPDSPSWEGDSRHVLYHTPQGLRRVLADGSLPQRVAVDLEWTPDAPPRRIVVHAGQLFDGVFETLRGATDLVIERGVIRDISAHRDELHNGVVVDASDEVVMPGLVDMHARLSAEYGQSFGRVWLAYGVTSVRLPAVNPYAALEQRESFDGGRRPGPRIFMAGDSFDGIRVYHPGGVSIVSDQQLDRELERATALGVDFFSTNVRLPDRFQKRLVEYARAQGKAVTSPELYPAVAFGVDGVEHLRGASRLGYSPKASAANRAYKDVIDLIAKSGVTLTPAIGIEGGFEAQMAGDKSLLYDRRLSLFPLPVVGRLTDLAAASANASLDARVKPLEETLKAIALAGGRIVAGTGAPIDPYGLSLHAELAAYVHAGLTPFQALQAATINAAQALGVQDQLGSIEVGKLADLSFLGGSPLDDIHNTRDVRRVMKGGRLYSVADLVRR